MDESRIGKDEDNLLELFEAGVKLTYGDNADAVLAAYRDIFLSPPRSRCGRRIACSSATACRPPRRADFDLAALARDEPLAADVLPGGALHSLVWGRDYTLENVTAFLQCVDADLLITGHIPCDLGFDTPTERQLILDCMGMPACYCLFPTRSPFEPCRTAGLCPSVGCDAVYLNPNSCYRCHSRHERRPFIGTTASARDAARIARPHRGGNSLH